MRRQSKEYRVPIVTKVASRRDPYQVLVSCLLSLRTKDKTTALASERLFRIAETAQEMLAIPLGRLEKIIYPVGFYRNKAKVIAGISKRIVEEFGGRVPDSLEGLLSLKGVGLKTANLVLGLGFQKPAICVDTHVHRISNRLGWVSTETPEESEAALKKIVPRRYWIDLNTILVTFGQNVCVPVSPFCTRCSVKALCKKRGVAKWR